jgi:hypothetical protein
MTKGIKYSKKAGYWVYYENFDTKGKVDEKKYFLTEKEAKEYAKSRINI